MPPVITALSSPVVRADTVRVTGTGFGFVSSVALYDITLQTQTPVEFFVDSGTSIHFTVPTAQPDGTYAVMLGTLQNDGTTSSQTFTLPDTSTGTTPTPGSFQANPIPDTASPAMQTIRARMRMEIGDYEDTFAARVVGDGEAYRFDLPAEVVDGTSLVVTLNGTPLVSGTDYTLQPTQGILTLTTPPADGEVLQAQGSNYQFFTDDELDVFILSAALKHTHNVSDVNAYWDADGWKHYDVTQRTVDTLAPVELHPVALLAAIEALEVISTDASFDMSVSTAEGTQLNREERFSNLQGLIETKEQKYDDICSMLGVGLNRVEVFNLRRVSRTTGRLVPLYRAKEYDDRGLPVREYVHVDSGLSGADTEGIDPYYGGGAVWP